MSLISEIIGAGMRLLYALRASQPVPKHTEAQDSTQSPLDQEEHAPTRTPAIESATQEPRTSIERVDDVMTEMHAVLLKGHPMIPDPAEMDTVRVADREVLLHLLDLPQIQTLQRSCKGDEYGAAVAMRAMHEVMVQALTGARSAAKDAEPERRRQGAEQELEAARIQSLIEALRQGELDGPGAQELQARIDRFSLPLPDPVVDAARQAAQGMEPVLCFAAQKAIDDLDAEASLARALGVDPGELTWMSVEERFELAQRLRTSRLVEFVQLIGQFRRVQRAESRKRVKDVASEMHGVILSNNLARLTTEEMLNLAHPTTEMLMWKRFADGQLLTHDVRGRERKGQGPIVVVCDESGSMTAKDVAGGSREAWSKALALAMLDQAAHRRRDFVYIGFSSTNQQHIIEFPGGQRDLQKVLTMTEHFFGGGTNFEQPLTRALDVVEGRGHKPRPDIVFMTDDEYRGRDLDPAFMARWNRAKQTYSIRCHGIAIGCSVSGSLDAVSDNVRAITTLAGSEPRAVGDLFRTI